MLIVIAKFEHINEINDNRYCFLAYLLIKIKYKVVLYLFELSERENENPH